MSCYLMRNATCVKSVCTMLDVRWICLKSLKDFLHKPKLCKSLRAVRSALTETTDLLTCSDWLVYWLVLLTGFIYWFHWLVLLTGFIDWFFNSSNNWTCDSMIDWQTHCLAYCGILLFRFRHVMQELIDTEKIYVDELRSTLQVLLSVNYRYCSLLAAGVAQC